MDNVEVAVKVLQAEINVVYFAPVGKWISLKRDGRRLREVLPAIRRHVPSKWETTCQSNDTTHEDVYSQDLHGDEVDSDSAAVGEVSCEVKDPAVWGSDVRRDNLNGSRLPATTSATEINTGLGLSRCIVCQNLW